MTAPTSYQAAARELLRTTLLDAFGRLLDDRNFKDIKMADIAAAASVSRQTLYNEFGSRREFVEAYFLRDAERILSDVERAVASSAADPPTAIKEAFAIFQTSVSKNPLVLAVITSDDQDGLLSLVTIRGRPLVAAATARLANAIKAHWPQTKNSDVLLLSECLVRLGISYAALPDLDPAATAENTARLLTPFVERALEST